VDEPSRTEARISRADEPSRWWYALLALPLLGLLWPPLYATEDPELFGFPFFYWYQFAWVFVAAAVTALVYLKTRRRR
jgi:hypothetical protein